MANSKTVQINLKAVADMNDVLSNVKEIQKAMSGLSLPKGMEAQFSKIFGNLEKNAEKASNMLAAGFKTKGDVAAYEKSTNLIVNDMKRIAQLMKDIDASKLNFQVDTSKTKALTEDILALKDAINQIRGDSITEISKLMKNKPSGAKAWQEFFDAFQKGDEGIEEAEKALKRLESQLAKAREKDRDFSDGGKWDQYAKGVQICAHALEILKGQTGEAAQKQQELDQKTAELANIQNEANAAGKAWLESLVSGTNQAVDGTEQLARSTQETTKSSQELNSSLEMFKTKATYFFGLANAANLFRRAIRSAYETVKDLDKVMTETAVVTNYTVGNMWDQLPQYTKRANELGVSIHDAYEAATLYYQQGLKTNEVMAVSNETLKMARIAQLDAAEATSRMTNALRGFNMEINETNAQRVNDVYSELAAITAADTNEISTAMTKVASLAHNANMEFETTSAFLAQMIETTRESAETAGTALKTVIARFSEVKELYNQGDLLGTDEEGEEIDVNKVSIALRSAGINLNEYLTGAKGLDDIFIELASKWQDLDMVQQRYIATMAAGSRQQSRFIAMMSDYKRTTELVTAANTSAGASQRQFEKTLESLQSKLAKLKNSWDTFVMGVADNSVIKAVIDWLTKLLDVVNNLTKKFDGFTGALLRSGMAFGGFQIGKTIVNKVLKEFGSAIGTIQSEGKKAGAKYALGFQEASGEGIKRFFSKKFWSGAWDNFTSSVDVTSANDLADSLTDISKEYDKLAKLREQGIDVTSEMIALEAKANALTEIDNNLTKLNISAEEEALVLSAAQRDADIQEKLVKGTLVKEEAIQIAVEEKHNQLRQKSLISMVAATIREKQMGVQIQKTTFYEWLQVKSKEGNIFATEALRLSEMGLITTTRGLVIATAAYVAILAAAVVAVYLAIKAFKKLNKNSPAEQLKKAEEASARAAEAAEEAANAYNNLNNSISSLSDKYETIEGMVRGTNEWKEAVSEVNGEVLDLMEKYDGLKVINENGVLKIENANEVTKQLLSEKNNTQAAQIAAQMRASQKKIETAYADADTVNYERSNIKEVLSSIALGLFMDARQGAEIVNARESAKYNTRRDLVTDVSTKLVNNELIKEGKTLKESVQDYCDQIGLQIEVTDEVIFDFKAFGNAIKEAENSVTTSFETLAAVVMSQAELQKGTEEQTSNFLSPGRMAEYEWQAKNEISSWSDSRLLDEYVKATTKYGSYNEYLSDEKADNKELDVEYVREQYAYITAMDHATEAANHFSASIGGADDVIQKAYSRKDFASLTSAEIEQIMSASGFSFEEYQTKADDEKIDYLTQTLGSYFDKMYELQSDEFKKATAKDLFGTDMMLSLVRSYAGKKQTDERFSNLGISNDFLKGVSGGAQLDYAKNLEIITEKSGEEAANRVNSIVQDLTKDMDDEVKERFFAALNSVDWENANALDNLQSVMDSFEVYGIDVTNLRKQIELLAQATREVKIEEIREQIQQFGTIAAQIKSGEQGRTGFTEEQVNRLSTLEGVDKKDFKYDAATEKYNYAGDKLEDIANAIDTWMRKQEEAGYKAPEDQLGNAQNRAVNAGIGDTALYSNNINDAKALDDLAKVFEEANKFEFDTDNLVDYIKQLKILNPELSDTLAAQTALANTKLNSGLKKIIDSYEDWTKLLSESGILLKNLDSESERIIKDLKANVSEMLNISGELPDSFWESDEAMAALQKTAEGDVEAFYDLKELAAEAILVEILPELDREPFEQALAEAEQYLRENELVAGASIDDTSFVKTLYEMLVAAGKTTDEINKVLRAIGVEIGYKSEKLRVPSGMKWENGMYVPAYTEVEVVHTIFSYGGGPSPSTSFASPSGGSGGGSGSSEKNDTWENPYDELYNLTEKINESLRTREALERRYEKLVKKTSSTVHEVTKAYYDQIRQLRYEADLQKEMQAGRARQLDNVANEYYTDSEGNRSTFSSLGVTKYASYDQTTGLLQIDWSGLEALEGDSSKVEEGKAAEAYISRLEELQDQFEEVRDKLWDIEDQIEELREEAIENYLTFEDRVMDALVNHYQKQIDEYTNLSDAIKSSQDEIIKGIQEEVNLSRQIRDNTKKEEDIADKEARLAYLRRDTSGANAMEIKKLEEEIGNARQSYSDTLIDQQLSDMQSDADAAAEQRNHQIEIMQNQLDVAKENGTLWGEVWDLINTATAADGTFSQNTELVTLLEESEAFQSLSVIGQMKWWEEVAEAFKRAQVGLSEAEGKYGVDANGDGTVSGGSSGATAANVGSGSSSSAASGLSSDISTEGAGHFAKIAAYEHPMAQMPSNEVRELQQALNDAGFTDNDGNELQVDGKYGSKTRQAVWKLQEKLGNVKVDGYYGPETRKSTLQSQFKAYATGGIADFTGPAWLDGTKSHPELVLNAKDTQNFIELKDILASMMSGQGSSFFGGVTNISVQVDSPQIASDYDLTNLADKIKKKIYEDSSYRNVNAINFMR